MESVKRIYRDAKPDIVIQLAVTRLTGFEGCIVWDTTKPNGQPRRKLDVTLAEKEFRFRAQTSFGEGLRKTIEWYISTKQTKETRETRQTSKIKDKDLTHPIPCIHAVALNLEH